MKNQVLFLMLFSIIFMLACETGDTGQAPEAAGGGAAGPVQPVEEGTQAPENVTQGMPAGQAPVNETMVVEQPETVVPFVEDASAPAAVDLSQYPSFFIQNNIANVDIVVGDGAPSSDVVASVGIATGIAAKASGGGPLEAKLASDISGLFDKNTVLLGKPCDNKWVHAILGREKPCSKVLENYGLVEGEGMIFLFEGANRKLSVVAAGTNAGAVKTVAKVLAKSDTYSISGVKVLVSGSEANPQVTRIE